MVTADQNVHKTAVKIAFKFRFSYSLLGFIVQYESNFLSSKPEVAFP